MYKENSFQPADREQRGKLKTNKNPEQPITYSENVKRKPVWIKAKAPTDNKVLDLKKLIRKHKLHTVCEEASCPNLGECFSHGTATFMIMGDVCTRRCPFCDVAHGKPKPLDINEPANLAEAVALMKLKYVVITSVDRDDLDDRGANHFVGCIEAIRKQTPETVVEILVPDFRYRIDEAVEILTTMPPDVFNHNLETVPRLYKQARPAADYEQSLTLIKKFKSLHADVPTKSGLMLGLGEELDEVKQVLNDLKDHDCDMITIGQYLQPSRYHLPVERFVSPDAFDEIGDYARGLGFSNVASAPMVRSSYHADMQAQGKTIK